ncbi:MAG: hypothetical protein ACK44O_06610 [Novosphingobium sp.]|nr:phage scaffolding protein [Novosphingobium sp.]
MPAWLVLLLGLIVWLVRNPAVLSKLREHVASAKFGDFEIELRELKQQVAEAKEQVETLKDANQQLSEIVAAIDTDAPVDEIDAARRILCRCRSAAPAPHGRSL